MPTFTLSRLAAPELHWQAMYDRLAARQSELESGGVGVWGIWFGQFGIPANELLVMTHRAGDDAAAPAGLDRLAGGERVCEEHWWPTVRPTEVSALTAPGLYVFRYFDVDAADIDEIATLSEAAWESFEHAEEYASRPLGLFRPAGDVTGPARMLLLTWYDGFESWSTSRRPPPEARKNFARRHALTRRTVAYATRLASAPR